MRYPTTAKATAHFARYDNGKSVARTAWAGKGIRREGVKMVFVGVSRTANGYEVQAKHPVTGEMRVYLASEFKAYEIF